MNDDQLFDSLLAAVDQQLESPDTTFVRKNFDRLIQRGLTPDQAREQIAICLGEESDIMWKRKRPFDLKSYRERLNALPFPEDEGCLPA